MGSHLLLLAPPPAHMIRKDPVLEAYQQEITYVFHALRWLGARPQEIEDLAQEVFIALRRAWSRYDSSRPLRPYLFGVAFRVVSMQRRKTKREVAFGRAGNQRRRASPRRIVASQAGPRDGPARARKDSVAPPGGAGDA